MSCTVPHCKNSNKKGFKVYRFPQNPERRKIWVQFVNRLNWGPTQHSVICEAHFEPSMFESNRVDGWRKLKPNAIPTVFKLFDNTPALKIIPNVIPTVFKIFDSAHVPKVFTSVSDDSCTANAASVESLCCDLDKINDENRTLKRKMEELQNRLRNANQTIKEKVNENSNLRKEVKKLQHYLTLLKIKNYPSEKSMRCRKLLKRIKMNANFLLPIKSRYATKKRKQLERR